MPDADPRLARFVELVRATLAEVADEATDLGVGFAVRTRGLPWVWTLNQLCVTAPAGAGRVADLAEAHQADLPYRHVVVRDAESEAVVEAALVARGWWAEHDLVMALETPPAAPDRAPDELTEDEMLALMREWLLEERGDTSAEGLRQVVEYNRLEGRRFGERRLGVRAADGRPLAVTKLRVEGDVGWVEDVYTTPSARGRGHARRLVTAAAAEAAARGCTLVSIVADADDWPQGLYREVGFRGVGTATILHRDAPATGDLGR